MPQTDRPKPASNPDGAPARPGARRRQTRTREALLAAARRLIVEGSRAAFTIDELTVAADVAKGSFYNHFPDKDAIAEEVYRTVREKEEAEIRSVNEGVSDPVARIARGMAMYAHLAVTSPEDSHILTLSQVGSGFLQSSVNAGLRDDLRAALTGGRVVAPSIEAAALLVVGQTAVLMARLRESAAFDEAQLVAQQSVAITLVGLGLSHRDAQLIATQAVDAILQPRA